MTTPVRAACRWPGAVAAVGIVVGTLVLSVPVEARAQEEGPDRAQPEARDLREIIRDNRPSDEAIRRARVEEATEALRRVRSGVGEAVDRNSSDPVRLRLPSIHDGARSQDSIDALRRASFAALRHRLGRDVDARDLSPALRAELRVHAVRVARLRRIRTLAQRDDAAALLARVNLLLARESNRHERRVRELAASN